MPIFSARSARIYADSSFSVHADHGANAGLLAARNFLEPIKKQFPWVTYSDLWTLGGVVAVQG